MIAREIGRIWCGLLLAASCALAAPQPKPPKPSGAEPPAAAIGKTTRISFFGPEARDAIAVWSASGVKFALVADHQPGRSTFDVQVPPGSRPGLIPMRLISPKGMSGLMALMLEDLPIVAKHEGNHSPTSAQPISFPCAVEGTCDPQERDYYAFDANAGQQIGVDVMAARLGSSMDPVVRLLDANGRELVWCDDDPAAAPDSRFVFTTPSAGRYLLELRDVNYDGGGAYHYHLRLGDFAPDARELETKAGENEPNDTAARANPLTIPGTISGRFDKAGDVDHFRFEARKGERLEFRALTRSLHSPCDAALAILKPDGSILARSKPAEAEDGVVIHTFAEPGTFLLRVSEITGASGQEMFYRLSAQRAGGAFSLSLETDAVVAAPGGRVSLKVAATRAKDYKGPIELSARCADLTLGNARGTIAAGKTEGELSFELPANVTPQTLHALTIEGHPAGKADTAPVMAGTTPALKRNFPRLLYPMPEFDGQLALWVYPAK